MALLRVNATSQGVRMHLSEAPTGAALEAAGTAGPVIVMVHGFKFLPGDPRHCPHLHIFSDHDTHPCPKALSWPRALGIRADAGGPLGVAFGWDARGTIWQAYAGAGHAGAALARLVSDLRRQVPERPVHAIAHSLGARVVLSALDHLDAGALNRVILLAGAEYRGTAEAMLATPAGRRCEVLNVTSRENRLYDMLLETAIAAEAPGDRALGAGLDACNAVTLRLDAPETLQALARLGHAVAPPARRVCHWSSYLRPGVFDLYAGLLAPGPAFARLRAALPGDSAPVPAPARRRFAAVNFSLPLARNVSS